MVHLHSVGGREHAAPGGNRATELADGLRRVVAVLEHLVAEDEVEGAVLDWQRLDRAEQVGGGVLDDVDADIARRRGEPGVVRLDAAADVEHSLACGARAFALRASGRAAPGRRRSPSAADGFRRRRARPVSHR